MTEITKKYTLLLILLAIMNDSCKKEKTEDPETVVTVSKDIDKTVYLPSQIGSGSSKINFSYNTNQSLSKIEYAAEGRSVVLSFNAKNLPVQLEKFDGETSTFLAEYTLDENDMVIKSNQYTIENKQYKLIGYYTLEYNSDLQLVRILNFNAKHIKLNEKLRIYDPSGNLIQEVSSSPAQTVNYSYDIKNGLFKNAGYAWLISLETNDSLLLSQLNNIQQATADLTKDTFSLNCSYKYNERNYPEEVTMTTNSNSLIYKVLYQ